MASERTVPIYGGRSDVQFATGSRPYEIVPAFSPDNVQHLLTVVEEPINGWKTVTHTFQAKDRDYADKWLAPFLAANPLPVVSFRFGLTAGGDAKWRAWEDHVVINHRVSMRPDPKSGPLVTIRTVDRLWLMHAVKRAKAHKGLVSSIVNQLWQDVGGSETVIEPTALAGHNNNSGVWYQALESDWSFFTRAVLPLARNAAGASGYRAYVKDNQFHFHSPGYGAPVLYQLPFTAGAPGFTMMSVEDRYVELTGGSGASGRRCATYDPITGTATMLESNSDQAVSFARSRSSYKNWEYRVAHVGRNLSAAEDARNQHLFSAISAEAYQLEFTGDKCLDLRVGDVTRVLLTGSAEVYAGLWLINKAVHTMREGSLTSVYCATRGEFNGSKIKAVVTPDSYDRSRKVGLEYQPAPSSDSAPSGAVLKAVKEVEK